MKTWDQKAPKKIPSQVELAYAEHIARGSKHDWCWEVNYAINSKFPRFFVYNVKTHKLYSYKCAHGIGGTNRTPRSGVAREFSNKPGSFMSSLGVVISGTKIRSDATGISVRLRGLSKTNSNMNVDDIKDTMQWSSMAFAAIQLSKKK